MMKVEVLRLKIAKLRLEPGDKLVVTCPQGLSMEAKEQIMEAMRHWAGPDFNVLLLPDGFTVSVVQAKP